MGKGGILGQYSPQAAGALALLARAAVAALARGIAVVAAVRAPLNGLVRGLVRRQAARRPACEEGQ